MKRILLVEDNETIILGLKYALEQEKFEITTAGNVEEAIKKIIDLKLNLVILDISLPDGNGFEVCKYIKESQCDVPIIFLTARDEEKDIISGLDMGADDYITKPFRVRELVSRINTILRRYDKTSKDEKEIKIKGITINVDKSQVLKNNEEIIFTSLEYRILLLLFNNPNKVITRDQILEKIWDIAGNFVNDNTLTVYIKRIREKIGDNDGKIIKTIRGLGYKVEE